MACERGSMEHFKPREGGVYTIPRIKGPRDGNPYEAYQLEIQYG